MLGPSRLFSLRAATATLAPVSTSASSSSLSSSRSSVALNLFPNPVPHPCIGFVQKNIEVRDANNKTGIAVRTAGVPKTSATEASIYDMEVGGIKLTPSNRLNFITARKLTWPDRNDKTKVHSKVVPNAVHRSASNLSPIARTVPNRSFWEQHRIPLETFEGNAKDHWIDGDKGWCHICQEPFGNGVGNHIGMRDHANMCVFLYLYTLYPRTWSAKHVVADSLQRYPEIAQQLYGLPYCGVDHMHTVCDVERRREIEALLLHLTKPPHNAITNSLVQNTPQALWVSGERMFKINLSRLCATMAPPMAAGVHTSFTQKCWSRTNLELMYDYLHIARIHEMHGVKPKEGKLDKAFFMRTMLWELHVARDGGRDVETMINAEIAAASSSSSSSASSSCASSCVSAVASGDYSTSTSLQEDQFVTQLLVEEVLRKISFELIHMETMQYMNRVQDLVRKTGFPTWKQLGELDAL